MSMGTIVRVPALLGALALAVAGCGGAAKGPSRGVGTSAKAPATVAASSSLKSGGSITVAAAQGIPQLDPYQIKFSFESVAHTLMWSALTKWTIDGGNAVQPDLAESWKPSNGFRTYTFRLRSGVRLSNGQPLTASMVAASLKRAFDPKTVYFWTIFLPKVKSIDAPNDSEVRIKLAKPARSLPEAMTKIPIEDVSALDRMNTDPVVTGPYKVESFSPDQNLVLVPNPNYYGPRPKLDRVTITKAQDNTAAFISLRAGEVQSLWSIPWSDVRQLASSNSADIAVITGAKPIQNVILEPDNQHGVFKNVKARQALAYSVDRAAILKAIYANRGVVPRGNDPIPPWSKLAKTGTQPYDFDLAKAKQLFTEAGVGPGTSLTFWTPAHQYTEWVSVGEVLQRDLAKIGIRLKIQTAEINQWGARFAPAGRDFSNLIVANVFGGLPEALIPDWWSPGICECNFDNAEYNKALADAQAAPDETAFRAAIGRAQDVFNEQAPVTIVVQTAVPVATVSALKNVWIDPTGDTHYADAGYAK